MGYWKENPDIGIAAVFAAVTACFAPLSWDLYVSYVNAPLLVTLYCLMLVIAGFREGGMLTYAYSLCFSGTATLRQTGQFFIFSCFFLSMAVTNDVALLLFVPLCIAVLCAAGKEQYVIFILTMQTIAANLGSMLTPVGNPQNLFLYSYYHMDLGSFFSVTAPITMLSGVVLYVVSLYLPHTAISLPFLAKPSMPAWKQYLLGGLFVLCIAAVLRVITPAILACVVISVLSLTDRTLFRKVDYKLLLLFALLFIGVGNLRHIPVLAAFPAQLVEGHVFFASLLLSQFLSNVPAAVFIAPYTHDGEALLAGVNIGGLGTMIASMASMITLKAYIRMPGHRMGHYVLFFTAANAMFLAVLLAMYCL